MDNTSVTSYQEPSLSKERSYSQGQALLVVQVSYSVSNSDDRRRLNSGKIDVNGIES